MGNYSLSITIPALNEEKNIELVLERMTSTLNKNKIDWELLLFNDGSTDNTAKIIDDFRNRYPERIKSIHHKKNMGLGYCIKQGIKLSSKKLFSWFPSDGENNPEDLIKYLSLSEYVDIIVPFTVNKGARSIFRRILSTIYIMTINLSFGTMFNYTNGNIIYRLDKIKDIDISSTGFFFQTEILIKSVRSKDILFAEVPVFLNKRISGKTTAFSVKNIFFVLCDFMVLLFHIHIIDRFK